MKTYKNLYSQITSFENLWVAAQKAQKGKRFRGSTLSFNVELEKNLIDLKRELEDQTYRCGAYREFYVQESKKRFICAAPYRDRVVHHALCNIIEPIFEKSFVHDSYACRIGKGTHKAVERFSSFLRNPNNQYVLKCDIKSYFPSIDHKILFAKIRTKIACPATLELISRIIDSSRTVKNIKHLMIYFPGDDLFTPLSHPCGIPIGNLTSQFFANLYLNDLDHYIKETLHCKYYVRYVDDFAICHESKVFLHDVKRHIVEFLGKNRLILHDNKCQVIRKDQGTDFLGYRIFATHRLVRKSNVKRYKRKLRIMQRDYQNGLIDLTKIRQRIMSWLGHIRWADSFRLRREIFDTLVFSTDGS